MTLSMYQASVPVFLRGLENLTNILAKGAAHAEAKASGRSALSAEAACGSLSARSTLV